jgi:hypothetical protein
MMVMQTIGMSGGTVTASDGTKVELPAGALTSDVTIGIAAATNAPAVPNNKAVGLAYTFTPEGTSFAKPITVTLAFDPAKLPSGKTSANVVIYKAPAGSANYTALPTTVVDATHVSATTQSFSTFQGAASEGGGGGCEPNCTAADGGCACTSTCGGKTYSLVCTQLGACQCNENGTAGNVVEVAGCSNLTALKMTFSAAKNMNGCGFPTAAP